MNTIKSMFAVLTTAGKLYVAYALVAAIVLISLTLTAGWEIALSVWAILEIIEFTVIIKKYGKKRALNGTWCIKEEYILD